MHVLRVKGFVTHRLSQSSLEGFALIIYPKFPRHDVLIVLIISRTIVRASIMSHPRCEL